MFISQLGSGAAIVGGAHVIEHFRVAWRFFYFGVLGAAGIIVLISISSFLFWLGDFYPIVRYFLVVLVGVMVLMLIGFVVEFVVTNPWKSSED